MTSQSFPHQVVNLLKGNSLESSVLPDGEVYSPASPSPLIGDNTGELLAKLLHILTGGSGCELVEGTGIHNLDIIGLIILEEVDFDEYTASEGYTATNLSASVYPVGLTLNIRLSSFKFVAGKALAILA